MVQRGGILSGEIVLSLSITVSILMRPVAVSKADSGNPFEALVP